MLEVVDSKDDRLDDPDNEEYDLSHDEILVELKVSFRLLHQADVHDEGAGRQGHHGRDDEDLGREPDHCKDREEII